MLSIILSGAEGDVDDEEALVWTASNVPLSIIMSKERGPSKLGRSGLVMSISKSFFFLGIYYDVA